MNFLADLCIFLWASVTNLVALLSGVVGLGIDMIRRWYQWEVPNSWYVWIVVVCLMMGMFSAWRDEYRKGQELQAQGLPNVIGKLQGDLTRAQEQFTSLQRKIALRRISPEQKQDLVQRLRGKDRGRSVMIKIVDGAPPEALRYAEDFADVFRELKWPGEIKGWWYLQIEDVAVRCRPHDLVADFLYSQLQAAGVELQLIETEEVGENTIEIVVGPKSSPIRDNYDAKN